MLSTYHATMAMADQRRAQLQADAEEARLVRRLRPPSRPSLLARWRWRVAPPRPVWERRLNDRRVCQIAVQFDRRSGADRRAAEAAPAC